MLVACTTLPHFSPQAAYGTEAGIAEYSVVGDTIPQALEGLAGDPDRGRRLVLDREMGNCLICHQVPIVTEPSQGDMGPPLGGAGTRLTVGQLRFRLVDQSQLNPATIMPPYHRVDGLTRVAGKYRSKPVFNAQEIEDVVAWLATLKD